MSSDLVEIKVGGLINSSWNRYEIDSDLLTAADCWRVSCGIPVGQVPKSVSAGAQVEVRMGGELVLVGFVDDREIYVSKDRAELMLNGRDMAGVLLDCSAPIFERQFVTLEQLAINIARSFGIKSIRVNSVINRVTEKFQVEPGELAWDCLRRVVDAYGLLAWFEPDGTLVIDGPNYDAPPVATLFLAKGESGSNILKVSEMRSIVGRFSEVTVFGKSGTNIHAKALDSSVPLHRPKVLVDEAALDTGTARALCRKFVEESRLSGYTLSVLVAGHRADSGVLWTPGQRVAFRSELHGIDGVFFLYGRRFIGGKEYGQRTELTLKQDGILAPEAHASRRRHFKAKGVQPLRVIDLS